MVDEVLSQNEIDALLSAITSGEMDADELKQEDESKVRDYDFKRALRFSNDQIRGLTRIHENLARLLTTFFSAQLRSYVNITVASVDQIPYEEFIRSIPKMTILNMYNMDPLEGSVLMEVNPNIAYGLLDRLLGGKGGSSQQVESLTEIDTVLMTQLFERVADPIKEAWESITDVDPELENFEVNPQFLQMVSPNETVVVVSLATEVGETSGMINICIPHIVLEPIIPNLSVHYWMQTVHKERDPEAYEDISVRLNEAEIDVSAVLGKSQININEFLRLNQGDVVRLDQSIDHPLTLEVNGKPKFYAQPGKLKNKLSVQIIKQIKKEMHGEGIK